MLRNMHYVVTILLVLVSLAAGIPTVLRLWMTLPEIRRLQAQARELDEHYTNPAPTATEFDLGYDATVWDFHIINGAEKVDTNNTSFHAVRLAFSQNGHGWMDIIHADDPDFDKESSDFTTKPAAGQYNNASLVGMRGYQPTPAQDIVMTCAMEVSKNFYGTAGCIFQPVGTLNKNGEFTLGTFNQFGVVILGKESRLMGQTGALGYGVTNWYPTSVCSLGDIDVTEVQLYKIVLRWVTRNQWQGIVYVNGEERCREVIPPLGAVEVQLWSDNYHLQNGPLGMYPQIKFQNGGEKYARFHRVAVWAEDRQP